MTSCVDHDDPQLTPIDTTQVKISADVKVLPNNSWLNPTEEMTITVSNVEMNAPKGVVLRSLSLYKDGYPIMTKPFSGETLEFKLPLSNIIGRLNISVIGNLIQKNCRDAEILIADNIQKIIFTQTPILECEGLLNVTVKSVSTSGEEYNKRFDVKSKDHFTIVIPQSELFWTPTEGTASTMEITFGGGATTWSPNSTLESKVTRINWGSKNPDDPVLKITIPNTPGALNQEKLQLYVTAQYYGVTENITVEPQNLISVFDIVESD